jgi:23S rRNA pseudoU1915 N3-methylase RlmH
VRLTVIAPWKLDSRGPFAEPVAFYRNRLSQMTAGGVQFVLPQVAFADERSATDFLVRECRRCHSEHFSLFCLDELGRKVSSIELADRVEKALNRSSRGIAFVLGGAYGLPAELWSIPGVESVSLSSFTFAHELALTVVLEQVYRVQCIRSGHPYHHGTPSAFSSAIFGRGRS